MTKSTNCILCALAALTLSACGQGGNRQGSRTVDEPVAVTDFADIPFFGNDDVRHEPYRLCEGELTSQEAMESAFPDSTDNFFTETTPEKDAFYYPGVDIRSERLARTVQLRYNYAALFNRVIHSYEWFQRRSTMTDEDEHTTRKDTLEWIRAVRPSIPESVIRTALPDARARNQADRLLKAYDRFDGDDSEDSPFSRAVARYRDAMDELPELVSEEETDRFEEGFWEWYDKKAVVPEIDTLIRMNMPDYEGAKPTDEQLENLRRAIEAERDIDRRAILALEYVKFNAWDGVPLLGEIIESRIYTKYLLEVWLSWRANVQMEHSPSSFSVIANNYYDKVRAICLDTMVRHCLQEEDKEAECLIENLIFCEIVHRMGSLAGNSSFNDCAMLSYRMFIHPGLLRED